VTKVPSIFAQSNLCTIKKLSAPALVLNTIDERRNGGKGERESGKMRKGKMGIKGEMGKIPAGSLQN
jgi:hypothetical protein